MKFKLSQKGKNNKRSTDQEKAREKPRRKPWKFLVVDDEPDIIRLTKMSLNDFIFAGCGLEILEADSAKAAEDVLMSHPDIAVAMIDVVMESDKAGLELIHLIRKKMDNKMIRLLIRTGQPGVAPERYVIENYDIDGYYDKTELTTQRLQTAMRSAIKSFRDLKTIDLNRIGLMHVLNATQDLYHSRVKSVKEFMQGVLTQIIGLFNLGQSGIIVTIEGMIMTVEGEKIEIQAGVGEFSDLDQKQERIQEIMRICHECIVTNKPLKGLRQGSMIVPLKPAEIPMGFIYLEHTEDLTTDDQHLLQIMANQCASTLENIRLHIELINSYDNLIEILALMAEYKDIDTGQHIARMSKLTTLVALELGVNAEEAEQWGIAALLHDVGKIGIPDSILKKEGPLTPEEYEIVKKHTTIGADILNRDKKMELAATIALMHHECWDGKGYPHRLRGTDIPLVARIVSVVDMYDALTNARPYKQAWSSEKAVAYLKQEKDRKLAPEVVDAFVRVLENTNSWPCLAQVFDNHL